ncbi:MAG: amidohydrolase family protein, partial [Pirellulaceae bacterium]|nr:amidohydrolase family protein [Pirellulaceae bacterium]
QKQNRDNALTELETFFEEVRDYQKARNGAGNKHPKDTRLEAMLPVIEGALPLIIHADETQQIQSAVAFANKQKVKMILHGGYDALRCVDLLKANNIPVIIGSVHRVPSRRDDDYDAPFTLAKRLLDAKIPFCISGTSGGNSSKVRNLPYQAGKAVAYGLSEEEAIKAITLSPAQIFGVGDQVGSLEVGKQATLIVTDGSPLEITTDVSHAYIQGAKVDLRSKHTRLFEKFKLKYERQGIIFPEEKK